MSDQKIEALEIGLYEDYLEELEKKYYQERINKGLIGDAVVILKLILRMEAEAEQKVKEFMDRNS